MQATKIYDKLMWLFTTLLFVMFSVMKIPYGGIVLAIVLLLVLLLYAAQHKMKVRIRFTYMHTYMLIFAGYIALSAFWAIEPGYATRRVGPLLETMLAMVILYSCYQEDGGIDKLLKALMWRGYFVLIYVVARYGINTIMYLLRNDMRIDNDVINANSLGLAAAYSIIINVYYIIKHKKIKILDLIIIPAFLVLAASGSRKALVLVVVGVIAVFIMRNWDTRQAGKSFLRIILIIAVLLVLGYFVLQLPFMEGILQRMDELYLLVTGQGGRGLSGYIRLEYIKLGMELFREHPILGIGIDNARIYTNRIYGYNHYLHNNYVELLACGGIIGTFLYYWIYVYLLRSFVKYKKYRDAEFDICLILMLGTLVMEYGMVTYESRETYYILLLFCLEVDRLRKLYKSRSVVHSTR